MSAVDLNDNPDNLPVLTEIAVPREITVPARSADIVVAELRVLETDPGGYDPYNNAPPVPAEEVIY